MPRTKEEIIKEMVETLEHLPDLVMTHDEIVKATKEMFDEYAQASLDETTSDIISFVLSVRSNNESK